MTTASFPTDPIAYIWREARTWFTDAMRDFAGPAEIARTLAQDLRSAIRRRLLLIESLLMKLLLIEAARLHPFPDARPDARGLSAVARRPKAEARRLGPITTIEASKVASAPHLQTPAAMDPRLGAARQAGNGYAEDAADPSTWRVRFRLRIPREPNAHQPPRDNGGARAHDPGDIWREQARRQLADRFHPKPDAEAAHRRDQAKARKLARRFEALRRVLADPRRVIARLARMLCKLGQAAYAAARRIALAPPPRAIRRFGMPFANAMIYACDASFSFRGDTS
jgi:hypothetical protein